MKVLLGGHELSMSHPVHHGLEIGCAGRQPARVGVAEVVDPDGQPTSDFLTAGDLDVVGEGDLAAGVVTPGPVADLGCFYVCRRARRPGGRWRCQRSVFSHSVSR